MGFTTCSQFSGGVASEAPVLYLTRSRTCPRCSERPYDRNMVRMVERIRWGLKWGLGPDEDDLGLDISLVGVDGRRRRRGGCSIL